ncbi:3'-5' exoribonuclease YhaM [Clostridium acetireducens DSM 10703]|uniref:3'-5' exoribonuclease YhaM n=1 Tax=Clostridium acetireducens DSM 10703 TaxID=1121290 RepID=A0A1E8F0P0_9CLOT|nr:HD domain-containing protein [Clostridium acetireducens]OFI07007.1 3'-5' exoribonuclease YhaM [Clostridium acetireducens DSM 10703]
MKKLYVKALKYGDRVKENFMVMKKLYKNESKTVIFIGDKTGDIKAYVNDELDVINVGDVINVVGILSNVLEIEKYEKVKNFDIEEYLPYVERPIEEIMNEIESISKKEFKTKECIELNNYFFKDRKFLDKFKKGIGGVSQHHNYIGGLAEHTLNVMYLSKVLAYRYNCNNREIAILGAKLHDIGKTEEYFTEGPFSFTLRGEMEGHIVIGVTMLEEAFNANPELYSYDFKERIKGCIVQHHGKLEYGSPKKPNTEEAYIVHYADALDAFFNKIWQIKKDLQPNTWSNYERRIEGKIYI